MISRILLLCLFLPLPNAFAQTKTKPASFYTDAFHAGANEYQFWGGYSPTSITWIGKSEARRLFMAGAGWRRVLLASNSVAWKFTLDVVPVTLVSQPTIAGLFGIILGLGPATCTEPQRVIESVTDFAGTDFGPCLHASRRTTYGFGLEPVGFDFNFRRRHRFQPVVGINGGFVKFTRDVPVANSNSFNFTFSLRGGVQVFLTESRSLTLGYRFHHISNANTGNPFNPGIDSNFIYAGYSFHR